MAYPTKKSAPTFAAGKGGFQIPVGVTVQRLFDEGDLAGEEILVKVTQAFGSPPHATAPRIGAVYSWP